MSSLLRAATDGVGNGLVGGLITVLFVLGFLFWVAWAYLPSRLAIMEAASRLPLEEP